jgi:hypothetical protein
MPTVAVAPTPVTPAVQVVTVQPPPTVGLVQPRSVPDLTARRIRRTGAGLRIAGWSMFATWYGASFIAAATLVGEDEETGWLFFPVLGPVILGTTVDAGVAVLSWFATLSQAAGLAMLIAGYVRRARVRRNMRASLAVLPAGPGGPMGLTVAGAF